MKKIIQSTLLIIVVIGGFFGYKYYQKTYASHVAYAQVPATIPTKEKAKDNNGKVMDNLFSYNYELTFVDEKGATQTIEYEIANEDPEPLKPNSFIKAEISTTRINKGPTVISEDDLPKTVAEKLTGK